MTAESRFHFIELRLSNKIITTGAGWPFLWKHGKITVESPFHFIGLRLCVSFCCKRKVMTCFHWNSTNLKPSFSSCGFYVTSKHLRCSQQNLFCLNFCGQFSLCESLIKGRILMYDVHEFFPWKIFHRTFCWHKIDSKLVFAFDNAFPLHNFIVFGFDYSFTILRKNDLSPE